MAPAAPAARAAGPALASLLADQNLTGALKVLDAAIGGAEADFAAARARLAQLHTNRGFCHQSLSLARKALKVVVVVVVVVGRGESGSRGRLAVPAGSVSRTASSPHGAQLCVAHPARRCAIARQPPTRLAATPAAAPPPAARSSRSSTLHPEPPPVPNHPGL